MRKLLALAVCLMLMGTITVNGTLAADFSEFVKSVVNSIFDDGTESETQFNVTTSIKVRNPEDPTELILENKDIQQILIPLNQQPGWEQNTTQKEYDGVTYTLWTEPGVIDKFIFITNDPEASEGRDAYFRSAISIHCSDRAVFEDMLKINLNKNTDYYDWHTWEDGSDWKESNGWFTAVVTYKDALAPGDTAPALMTQVALEHRKELTNEKIKKFGQEFTIVVKTVAVDASVTNDGGEPMSYLQALEVAAKPNTFLK